MVERIEATRLQKETPDISEELLQEVSERLKTRGLNLLRERFETTPREQDRLPFHNVAHTEGVMRRMKALLDAIEAAIPRTFTNKDRLMAVALPVGHDLVQAWKSKSQEERFEGKNFKKVVRERATVQNEKDSARELIEFMIVENQRLGRVLFTEDDGKLANQAFYATVASFDSKRKTVYQPALSEDSPILVRALALADVGAAGMEPDQYIQDGDNLFREENLDILEALKNPSRLAKSQRDYLRHRMLRWTESQIDFALGRKSLLDNELEGLNEVQKEAVRGLFNAFDESIKRAREVYERRKRIRKLEDIAKDMGYTLAA